MIDYVKTTKEIISKIAGTEVEDIHDESDFIEDLNIGEIELHEIFGEVEERFDLDLTEEKEEFETFGDLIGALHEKLD